MTDKKDLKPLENDPYFKQGERLDMVNETIPMLKTHIWHQKGHEAYCTACAVEHGLYLGTDKEVREGKIVKKL